MITCQNCKTENKEDSLRCVKCGAPFINFTTSGCPLDLSPLYEILKPYTSKKEE